MKLILQAIKAMFRKVWNKLTELKTDINNELTAMEADTNSKLDELKKAIDALTPMVVHITGDYNTSPVIDKTIEEIVTHLKNGGKAEFVLNGQFVLDDINFMPNNIPLQITQYDDFYIAAVSAFSDAGIYSIVLRTYELQISHHYYDADNLCFNFYPM